VKREYKLFVQDIADCIEKVNEFVGGMTFEEFSRDDKTISAVVRKLEIIGEATKNLPKSLRAKHPEVPWKDMAGMRDKIIHAYFGLNLQIVWKVVKERLPELKPLVKKVLKELEAANPSML